MHVGRNDLNLLVSFHRLLATRSVTAAAAEEGVTQSAMSRTLTRLRATFDDPLFVRTRRGLEPTRRALELEMPTRTAVESARAVFEGPRPAFEPATTTRELTIATTDIAALVVLPRLLRRMSVEAPHASVTTRPLPAITAEALETGSIDLVIGFAGAPDPQLRWQLLFEDTLACVARTEHPALTRKLTMTRYLACRHLSVTPSTGPDGVDRALGRQRRTVAVRTTHFLAAPALLCESDLVLTTGARVAHELARLAPLQVVDSPVQIGPVRIGQLWHERSARDPAHAWFRALVKATTAEP